MKVSKQIPEMKTQEPYEIMFYLKCKVIIKTTIELNILYDVLFSYYVLVLLISITVIRNGKTTFQLKVH